jgi:hypothetical protein
VNSECLLPRKYYENIVVGNRIGEKRNKREIYFSRIKSHLPRNEYAKYILNYYVLKFVLNYNLT